jgi:hypothetical protein
LGGRSGIENEDQWGQGSCYIPKVGSFVWIFFEGGNINRPWYFGSMDIETSKVLPENQAGSEYQHKWTIFKSSAGRAIVVSDDCDERIEITGKKRQLKKTKENPEGDIDSVYQIEENQTTILLEETEGNEKLLIKTWKGDFINIDIETRELNCYFKNNITIRTDADLYIDAANIYTSVGNDYFLESKNTLNIASNKVFVFGDESLNLKSETNTLLYGGEFVSIYAESDLLLTGYETIHQYTAVNLIGGDVNIGLVIPRKAPASEAAIAGLAGKPGKLEPYGKRSTNKDCDLKAHPNNKPSGVTLPNDPEEITHTPDNPDIPEETTVKHDGLIPEGFTPSIVFGSFSK